MRRITVLMVVAVLGSVAGPAAPATAAPLQVAVSGTNGSGRITTPGRSCQAGGDGAYWHYDYEAPVTPGVFSSLAGAMRLHLDLHSNQGPSPTAAFLLGDESTATLANSRGVLPLILRAGSCDTHALTFNGVRASGGGSWVAGTGTGAYRQATGSGPFSVTADVAPGADNPFTLSLDGAVQVLQPSLDVEVVDTYWGFLGAHYAIRWVTVVYRITNTGPGDSFAARLADVTAEPDVRPLGPVPQHLGDLASGESTEVRLRFELGLNACGAVVLSCEFDTTLHVQLPDALDVATTATKTVTAKAPDFAVEP